MPPKPPPSPYMTTHEVAAFVRLAARTLENMRQRGTGPPYCKLGGRVVYDRDDVQAWATATRRRRSSELIRTPPDNSPTHRPP